MEETLPNMTLEQHSLSNALTLSQLEPGSAFASRTKPKYTTEQQFSSRFAPSMKIDSQTNQQHNPSFQTNMQQAADSRMDTISSETLDQISFMPERKIEEASETLESITLPLQGQKDNSPTFPDPFMPPPSSTKVKRSRRIIPGLDGIKENESRNQVSDKFDNIQPSQRLTSNTNDQYKDYPIKDIQNNFQEIPNE